MHIVFLVCERIVVGVNKHTTDEAQEPIQGPDFSALEARQRAALTEHKQARDASGVAEHLAKLGAAATGSENMLPVMIDAVKDGVTLGEISDALRAVWGTHDNPL